MKEPKTDCFAFVEDGRNRYCNALKYLYCMFEECKFYKKCTEVNKEEKGEQEW